MRRSLPARSSGRGRRGARLWWTLVVGGAAVFPAVALAAPAAEAATAPTSLYVATTGSDTGNSCQARHSPCATIGHAVTEAESLSGRVVINVAPGTYAEQVTITPAADSPMRVLTLVGHPTARKGPVLVMPTTVTPNVCEGTTSNFFDDNTGAISAVVGVQTGVVTDVAACSSTPATGSGAVVNIRNLTVTASGLSGVPGNGLDGIALIDTSGVIAGNHVYGIQQPAELGDVSVHGIEVKSTNVASKVTVRGNRVNDFAGHVGVDLMGGAPGSLLVRVIGNDISGNPSSNPSTSVAAQFGIAAGGVKTLFIAGNRIDRYQSPWDVGAIWLDRQAAGAACTVTGNRLLANDDGVDLRGAQGCRITRNIITAGVAGVEAGQGVTSQGAPFGSAPDNVIAHNRISGRTTDGTKLTYTGQSAITGKPSDGVLVWSGQHNTIADNAVSGFVADVYVGADPVYLNNTATWNSVQPYAKVFGTRVTGNDITRTVTAMKSSGVKRYGVANLNHVHVFRIVATGNWWGCAAGPNHHGCTTTAGPVQFRPFARHRRRV